MYPSVRGPEGYSYTRTYDTLELSYDQKLDQVTNIFLYVYEHSLCIPTPMYMTTIGAGHEYLMIQRLNTIGQALVALS